MVKGVFMGIVISGVTHASKSISGALVRHPLALFATGVVGGYLTHKYRKEIIIVGSRTAEESKNFRCGNARICWIWSPKAANMRPAAIDPNEADISAPSHKPFGSSQAAEQIGFALLEFLY